MRAPAVPKQPKGTNGFSLVFLLNFSLNVSSRGRDKGVKPSITGGWEKSKATGELDFGTGTRTGSGTAVGAAAAMSSRTVAT